LAKRFQRRRLKCEKLTDDGCQEMQGELKRKTEAICVFYITLLPYNVCLVLGFEFVTEM
jgi:hypothetical protein